jgi:DnaJ-class molecular chaperone
VSETSDKMVAGLESLRASTKRYQAHNRQIGAARAAECAQCQGTGLHPEKPSGACPTCKGRRTR